MRDKIFLLSIITLIGFLFGLGIYVSVTTTTLEPEPVPSVNKPWYLGRYNAGDIKEFRFNSTVKAPNISSAIIIVTGENYSRHHTPKTAYIATRTPSLWNFIVACDVDVKIPQVVGSYYITVIFYKNSYYDLITVSEVQHFEFIADSLIVEGPFGDYQGGG